MTNPRKQTCGCQKRTRPERRYRRIATTSHILFTSWRTTCSIIRVKITIRIRSRHSLTNSRTNKNWRRLATRFHLSKKVRSFPRSRKTTFHSLFRFKTQSLANQTTNIHLYLDSSSSSSSRLTLIRTVTMMKNLQTIRFKAALDSATLLTRIM